MNKKSLSISFLLRILSDNGNSDYKKNTMVP